MIYSSVSVWRFKTHTVRGISRLVGVVPTHTASADGWMRTLSTKVSALAATLPAHTVSL